MTNCSKTIDTMLGHQMNEVFTQFYISGHAFGAYIVGNYAVKYKEHLKKLIFISPIGLHDDSMISDEEKAAKEKEFFTGLATGPFANNS